MSYCARRRDSIHSRKVPRGTTSTDDYRFLPPGTKALTKFAPESLYFCHCQAEEERKEERKKEEEEELLL
jgi:hypothetical protein